MFNFPWSNFHELNLDWILSVVKEAKEIFTKGEGDIQHAVEAADQALETAEQAAAGVIADGAVTIPKLNSEVYSLLAYCVSGSVAPNFIPAGALVILRKSTIYNVSDGIYTATRNIPQAAIITAADLDQSATLYREGGMNYLLHNEEKLSGTIDLIKAGLVILVTGDEASAAVPADGLVYVANNTHGLTEGFYFNSSGATFPTTGGTADSDSFTAINNILNALQTTIATLGSDDITNDSTVTGVSVTDALDEVKNTLTQLETETATIESGLAIPQTGDNASQSIPAGAFIYLTGNSNQTDFPDGFYQNTSGSAIGSGAVFTISNLTRQYQGSGALNTLGSAITPGSGTIQGTASVNASNCSVFKSAGLISVLGAFTVTADIAGSGGVLGTLSEEFCPVATVVVPAYFTNYNGSAIYDAVRIQKNGTISTYVGAYNVKANSKVFFTCTFA